jgi:hypothetical protein
MLIRLRLATSSRQLALTACQTQHRILVSRDSLCGASGITLAAQFGTEEKSGVELQKDQLRILGVHSAESNLAIAISSRDPRLEAQRNNLTFQASLIDSWSLLPSSPIFGVVSLSVSCAPRTNFFFFLLVLPLFFALPTVSPL